MNLKNEQIKKYEEKIIDINTKIEKFGNLMEQLISENQKLRAKDALDAKLGKNMQSD